MEEKVKILTVDDEQIVCDSIKRHLRKEKSYKTYEALSVEAALEILENEKIDIVLTDLMMPEIDGLEFLKILKKKYPKTLAIMITGYATINSALQATQLGAFDYIAKPFTKEELKKIVARAADLAKVAGDAEKNGGVFVSSDLQKSPEALKGVGENAWLMRLEDGAALIGVERLFVIEIGRIQTLYLPSVGDELRQGSVYFQAFSTDLRSHAVLSPLSGIVLEVNEKALENPNDTLQDPYDDGWLIKLDPTKFDEEIKTLGLG